MDLVRRSNTTLIASSIKNQIINDPIISPETCIFRTPSILKRHNEAAFVPNAVSIGPFHQGEDNLKDGQRFKLKYLGDLVKRNGSDSMLDDCIEAIKDVVDKARKCYNVDIGMYDDDFIQMLVLDGCFIVELFRKDANVVRKDKDDPIFTMCCMRQFLYHDLILLENQIPWFVLELLFTSTTMDDSFRNETLVHLALAFFDHIFTSEEKGTDVQLFVNHEIKHILDLLRSSLVLPLEKQQKQKIREPPQTVVMLEPLPSAAVMARSGIKFTRVTSRSILDVKFVGGRFEMPALLIQETLEPALRNLISYEQCYPNCAPRVTCYAMILDNLINTTEDIDQLARKGILINWLNPQDATDLFQKLYRDAYVKDLYYQDLCRQVQKYRYTWVSLYIRYFLTPWAIVTQIVGGIVTVATIIQTVYTVMSVKN